MPPVHRYMTPQPHTVARTATLSEAHRIMREHQIRHLPVMDDGELCGILSDRDLRLIEAVIGAEPETTLVDEAMTEKPFIVTADTPLDDVVEIMGEHKYGSVVVVGRDGVEGIFTAVDACKVLAQVLRDESRPDTNAGDSNFAPR